MWCMCWLEQTGSVQSLQFQKFDTKEAAEQAVWANNNYSRNGREFWLWPLETVEKQVARIAQIDKLLVMDAGAELDEGVMLLIFESLKLKREVNGLWNAYAFDPPMLIVPSQYSRDAEDAFDLIKYCGEGFQLHHVEANLWHAYFRWTRAGVAGDPAHATTRACLEWIKSEGIRRAYQKSQVEAKQDSSR